MGRKRNTLNKKNSGVTDQQKKVISSSPLRSCEIVTYVSEYHIKEVLERWQDLIKEYAFIRHDHDKYTQEDVEDWKTANKSDDCPFQEGQLKQKHYHVLLVFWKQVRASTVLSWFFDPYGFQNSRVSRIKGTLADAYRYLDHSNRPDKFQYPRQCIQCSSIEYWENLDDYTTDNEDPLRDALIDRLDGVPYRDLVMRYGRDFIVNSRSLDHCVDTIVREEGYTRDIVSLQDSIYEMERQVILLVKQKARLEADIKAFSEVLSNANSRRN